MPLQMAKPPDIDDKNFDYMKTTKDNINNVLKDKENLSIIFDLVNRTNKIVIQAYQFIKLYCIHRLENDKQLPVIDKKFICDIFKAITTRNDNRGSSISNPKNLKKL